MHILTTTLSFVSNGASPQLSNLVSSGDIFLILFVALLILSAGTGLFALLRSNNLVLAKHGNSTKPLNKRFVYLGVVLLALSLVFLAIFGATKFAFAQENPSSDNSKIELTQNVQAVVDGIDGTITEYPKWDLKNLSKQTMLLKSVETKSLNGNNFNWKIIGDDLDLYNDKPDKANIFEAPVPLSPVQSMVLNINSVYDKESALSAIGSQVLDISFTLEEVCVVTGKIIDQYGFPLEEAKVVFYDDEGTSVYETTTDSDGNYLMYILPSTVGHITASYDGKFDNDSVDFTCEQDIQVDDIILYDEKTLEMSCELCAGQTDKGESSGALTINNGTSYEVVISEDGLNSSIVFKQRGLDPVSVEAASNPANGFCFGNWYLDVDGTMQLPGSGILTDDMVFYAKFVENPDTMISFGGRVLSDQLDMGQIAAGDYLVRGNGIKWTVDGSQVVIGEGSLTQNIVASPTTDNGCVFSNWMLDGETLTDGQIGYFYYGSAAFAEPKDSSNFLMAEALDHIFNPVFVPSPVKYNANVSVSKEAGQSDMGQVLPDEGKSIPYSLGELSKWTISGNKIIFCVEGSSFQQNAVASPYDGYVFDTWELDGSTLSDGQTGNLTDNVQFTAKFKMGDPCDVNSLIANDMTDKGVASNETYTFGQNTNWTITDNAVNIGRGVFTQTLVADPVTDNGYKFDHWSLNDPTGATVSDDSGKILADTTFYAVFEQNGAYSVVSSIIDLQNIEEYGSVEGDYTVGQGTKWEIHDSKIVVGVNSLAKEITSTGNSSNGQTFNTWFDDSEGLAPSEILGNVSADTSFYASFKQDGEYDINGLLIDSQVTASDDYGHVVYYPASGFTVGKGTVWNWAGNAIFFGTGKLAKYMIATPNEENGMCFDNWYTDKEGTVEIPATGNVESSLNFYSAFAQNGDYLVDFNFINGQNSDYGTLPEEGISVGFNTCWSISENQITFGKNTLARTISVTPEYDNGQIFDKWFNQAAASGECSATGNITADKTFYAQFKDDELIDVFADIVSTQKVGADNADFGSVSTGDLESVPKGKKWTLSTEDNVGYVTFGTGSLEVTKAFNATGNYNNGKIFEAWYNDALSASECDTSGNITTVKTFYSKFKNDEQISVGVDFIAGQNTDYGTVSAGSVISVPKGMKWTLSIIDNVGYVTFGCGTLSFDKAFSATGNFENGKIFDRWLNESSAVTYCEDNGNITEAKTFYARFKDDELVDVSLDFVNGQNTDYGTVSYGTTTSVPKGMKWSLSVQNGIGYVSFGTGSLVKTEVFSATGNKENGQIFSKWYNDSAASSACGLTGNLQEAKTFYAQFKDDESVDIGVAIVDDQNIDNDYGFVSDGSLDSVPKGIKWTLSVESNIGYVTFGSGSLIKTKVFSATGNTDNGQIFDKWCNDASASEACPNTGYLDSDKTFYAQFKDDALMTVKLNIVSSQGSDQGSISKDEFEIPKGKVWAITSNKVNFDSDSSIITFGTGSLADESVITSNTDNGYLFNKWYSDDGSTPLSVTSGAITSSPVNFYVDFAAVTISGKLIVTQSATQSQRRQILAKSQTISFNYQDGAESITCTTQNDGSYKIIGFPLGSKGNLTVENEIGYRLVDGGAILDRKVNIDGTPGKGVVSNVEKDINLEGSEFDYYSLDELKTVTDDLSTKGSSSKYYNEFSNTSNSASYIKSNSVWYSHSQGQYNPSSPDTSVLDSNCECSFVEGDSVNNYLFLRIIGVNHDIAGSSNTRPITFQTLNALPISASYDNKDNGYWGNSQIRTFLNGDVYNKLASGFKSNIVEVNKYSNDKHSADVSVQKTQDKLFVLSYAETTKTNTSLLTGLASWYAQGNEGSIYEWYNLNSINGNGTNSVLSNISCNDGSMFSSQFSRAWLRSAYVGDSGYLAIQKDGNPCADTGWNAKLGCMPAFCF